MAAAHRARAKTHVDHAPVRLGILQFGTVQWVADVIRHHAFDKAQSTELNMVTLANTGAGRVALMAGAADVVVSDWMFVAAQRAAGTRLCFAPFSSATGGVVARGNSPILRLTDLKGRNLGVAGGPVDKSWLLVRAAGRAQGIDLATEATIAYGAPPLLGAKLRQRELDAVLTFWNFVAELDATGFREAITVEHCAHDLGLTGRLSMVGFVFHQDWAEAHKPAINGFLRAAQAAQHQLAVSDAEWQRIRPLIQAPDDAVFAALKRRFIAGIALPSAAQEEQTARQMFDILLRTGGTVATAGLTKLPDGMFWPTVDADG